MAKAIRDEDERVPDDAEVCTYNRPKVPRPAGQRAYVAGTRRSYLHLIV